MGSRGTHASGVTHAPASDRTRLAYLLRVLSSYAWSRSTRQTPSASAAPIDYRAAPPAISPALAALAADLALDADTTAMFARINVGGAQPTTRDGWLLVWEAIRHACAPHDRDGADETGHS